MSTDSFTFQNIKAWQKSHSFVLLVYNITQAFPKEEIFGLTSQFRRAAVSIEANIAEGYKKLSKNDKLRFFNIAEGSIEECRDYIILSFDLEYITKQQYEMLVASIEEASKLLNAYSRGIINNNAIKD